MSNGCSYSVLSWMGESNGGRKASKIDGQVTVESSEWEFCWISGLVIAEVPDCGPLPTFGGLSP